MNVGSALSGMQAASLMHDMAALKIANVGGAPDSGLAEQVTNLIMASVAYDANARVAQSQDEMAKMAIDVIA